MVEYVLILSLVAVALIAVLTITGPAVGNVFSNAVYNLLGQTLVPRETLEADEFWTQVAAVASFTPENPLLITNTAAAPSATATMGSSPTPTDVTPSPTATYTHTSGPSPTPPDQNFGYPFYDPGENPDWWQHDFNGILGTWDAEFWDMSNVDGYSPVAPDMTSMPSGSGVWSTQYEVLDQTWSSSPGGSVTNNFYARFTNSADFNNVEYVLRARKDDGMRVWVGGALIYDAWDWSINTDTWQEIPFTPAEGVQDIMVELYDNHTTARASVFILGDYTLLDEGDCNWSLTSEDYYSAPSAWSDSPGAYYSPNSYCVLRLRGYIDLTGATSVKLEFYERYALSFGATTYVGVSVAGTDVWTDVPIHTNETNLGWSRQTFDLSNFGGQDFTNQLIELRFVLDNRASGTTNDGWWIDDVQVDELVVKQYTVGFYDNVESDESHWYPGGRWARTNEYVHSGGNAWSDSPSESYITGTNNILELDGIVVLDNAMLEDDPVDDPELVFWHRYDLANNAKIFAEVSTDERASWQALTGTYLAYRTSNWSWTQVVIPLDGYVGQTFYFRFRLEVPAGSTSADGWFIDDISLRNSVHSVIRPNWCDNLEDGGASWLTSGTWAIVDGTDHNDAESYDVDAHSGSQFFSDSPGANYSHNSNSWIQLNPFLDLTAATRPELVFWHQWHVASDETLNVEVSTNEGQTWTSRWVKQWNTVPPDYGSTTVANDRLDYVVSWTRDVVDLSAYAGQEIMVRFRFDALSNSSVDDGWWIDDICFQEHSEPIYSLPFQDGFEAGAGNWYVGGTWAISTNEQHDGGAAFTDSPDGDYGHETNSILQLHGALDFRGTVKPTIYFWDRFNLTNDDNALVEFSVSGDGGNTWSDWESAGYNQYRYTVVSWDRRQLGALDMSAFTDKLVRLRFRLYAERHAKVAGGWWIDDILVVDRNGIEPIYGLPFNDNAELQNDDWVFDGTWGRVHTYRDLGTGSGLGPGGWTAEYFDDADHDANFDAGELVGTRVDSEIDFNWTGNHPVDIGITSDNYFLVRWTRTINVSQDNTGYQVQMQSDDGIRLIVDGVQQFQSWSGRSFNSLPDTADITLDRGPHTIVVEYFERTGSARVLVNITQLGYVFHDSPDGNYLHNSDMSMTLEGTIDLSGTVHPALTYWEKLYRGDGDSMITEISTDEGYTWTEVRRKSSTDSTWHREFIDLSAYAGQRINIRFRLKALTSTSVNDGWYIDDIQVAE